MEQYISKSALVAEIKKRRNKHFNSGGSPSSEYCHEDDEILGIIATLEVKEVDLDEEIKEEYLKRRCYGGRDNMLVILSESQFNKIAKHFFELGLRSTITEEDCKLIWNIGDEIPNMPEEEFFKELLKRFKAQKGEGI